MAELKELVSMTPSFEQTIKPAQEKLAESTKAKAEVAGAEKAMLTQAEADRQRSYQQAGETATQAVKTSPVFAQKEEVFKKTSEPFIPTQDDAKDIAALYSLVNVVGMAMGAGGKQNSMQAMHAMNGMLDGYQKGRSDLYKKEKDKFDVNMKNLKSRYDMLDKQLKDVMTLAQTDREAARQAADVAFAQSGANFYKQMADKIGIAGLYEYHKQAYDAANKLFAEKNRLEAQAEQRNYRERMLALQEKRLQKTQDRIGGGGQGGKPEKPEKPPVDVEKSVRQNALFLDNITDIVSEAENLIKDGKIRGIGVVQGKIPYDVAQLYMTTEERNFLQNFNALTNQKLKDQSGATVTGAEFARQRGVLPLRDDEPNVVLDKLRNWRRLIGQETSVIGRAYPSIIKKYGIVLDLPADKNKLVTGLEYNTPKGVLLWDGNTFVSPFEVEE